MLFEPAGRRRQTVATLGSLSPKLRHLLTRMQLPNCGTFQTTQCMRARVHPPRGFTEGENVRHVRHRTPGVGLPPVQTREERHHVAHVVTYRVAVSCWRQDQAQKKSHTAGLAGRNSVTHCTH